MKTELPEHTVQTTAVIFERPGKISLADLPLDARDVGSVVVNVDYSGVSSGTERLLWEGRMPSFPGMGYPLVPGYEAVGTVAEADRDCGLRAGDAVFVPGAACYGDMRALFGAASRTLVAPARRLTKVPAELGRDAVALALAATAYHAIANGSPPDLVVGHGALGRLIARLASLQGGEPPVVWEARADRATGDFGYPVVDPACDDRRDYGVIYDASGDANVFDDLVGRLGKGGEIVLAGFYPGQISFSFAPAFMREARFRIAAEWQPDDMANVIRLVEEGRLSLDGLVSHTAPASDAAQAYATAFEDPDCLKMTLDWRSLS